MSKPRFSHRRGKIVTLVILAKTGSYYTFTVDSALTVETRWNSIIYVVTDCENTDDTCVGAVSKSLSLDPEVLTMYMKAFTTYYVVVDGGSASASGPYRLTVSDVCEPDCSGDRNCGPDGCGFTCGECHADFQCDQDGYCQPVMGLGNTCNEPIVVAPSDLPCFHTANTETMDANYHLEDACGDYSFGAGAASRDAVYAFTPEVTGVYTIEGTALEGIYEGYENIVYVVTDCTDADGTCVDAVRSTYTGDGRPSTLRTILEQGITYYIIFDGLSDTADDFHGPYTMSISEPCVRTCGTNRNCGDDGCGYEPCDTCESGDYCDDNGMFQEYTGLGDTCTDPYAVGSLPFIAIRNKAIADGQMSFAADQCPGETSAGGGSNDEVYAFTPTVRGAYSTTLTADDFDSVLYVVTDCSDIANTCLDADDLYSGEETLTLMLEAGTTYYIVVDGWSNSSNDAGHYQLEIDEPCTQDCDQKYCGDDGCGFTCGECPPGSYCSETQACATYNYEGDSCHNPFVVTTVPFTDSGDTSPSDLNNVYATEADSCAGMNNRGQASNDVVYEFQPSVSGNYTIETSGDLNAAIYVVTDCTDVSSTCLGGAETGTGIESLTVYLEYDTTYYIIIDGSSNFSNTAGPYSISIN